jgi:hypothetical protein
MHCRACDVLLTDYDVTLKSEVTGEYLDMCSRCRSSILEFINVVDDGIELPDDKVFYDE